MSGTKQWGSFAGKAESNKHTYLTMPKAGEYRVRLVSGVLPRYVYWIENKALGVPATFDCMAFDRNREKFDNSLPDPIRDMHIKQFNKFSKKEEEIKVRRNYLCWVIDREDGKLKLMELKPTLNDSINSMMKQLYKKGLTSPLMIDLVIERSGERMDTKYQVQLMEAIDALGEIQDPESETSKRLAADVELLGAEIFQDGALVGFENVPDLAEVFPAPFNPSEDGREAAAEKQRQEVLEFLAKTKTDEDGSANKHDDSARSSAAGAGEAAQDL